MSPEERGLFERLVEAVESLAAIAIEDRERMIEEARLRAIEEMEAVDPGRCDHPVEFREHRTIGAHIVTSCGRCGADNIRASAGAF